MIQVKLDEVLEEKGHTLYWLAKETGISHNTLWRMNKGLSTGITFDVLDRITDALECEPSDILVKVVEGKKKSKGNS
ncbi:MAG TPA: helix-turn-helix transcriptional regulator [Blastocatellia bacterium]|nr:helix-turn-helix transcriptional regulator [Blastocatellia bacterium]